MPSEITIDERASGILASGEPTIIIDGPAVIQMDGGGGDVVGPAGATGDAAVVFDGDTGKLIKELDSAFRFFSLTTAQRDALTPGPGWVLFNSTTGQYEGYNGTAWQKLDQDFQAFQTLTPTGTTQVIDLATGRNWVIDLGSATGDVTVTLNNPTAGVVYTIKVIQGAVDRNLIWPASVLWSNGPPTITSGNDAIDVLQLMYDAVNYLGLFALDFS
jgi:hypothetical protein